MYFMSKKSKVGEPKTKEECAVLAAALNLSFQWEYHNYDSYFEVNIDFPPDKASLKLIKACEKLRNNISNKDK